MTSSNSSVIANVRSTSQLAQMRQDFNSFEDSLGGVARGQFNLGFDCFPGKHTKGGIVKGLNSQEGDPKFLSKDRVKKTSSFRKKIQIASNEETQPSSSQESLQAENSSTFKSYVLIKPLTICGTVIQT